MIGLENLGNTCYMNSVLQCLNHTKFKYAVMEEPNGGELIQELKHLFRELDANGNTKQNINIGNKSSRMVKIKESRVQRKNGYLYFYQNDIESFQEEPFGAYKKNNNAIHPIDLKNLIDSKTRKFWGNDTHDCVEFFVILLDLLKNESNAIYLFLIKAKVISEIYHYQEKSYFSCFGSSTKFNKNTDQIVDKDDSFYLNIPIKGSHDDLSILINEYLNPKKLSGNVTGTEQITITHFPEILVINLRRISKNYYYENFIRYPEELNLSFLTCSQDKNLNSSSTYQRSYNSYNQHQKNIYKLKAFIIHEGNSFSGHKIAICFDKRSNRWLKYDDSHVNVCNNPFKQDLAFLFFYEKV